MIKKILAILLLTSLLFAGCNEDAGTIDNEQGSGSIIGTWKSSCGVHAHPDNNQFSNYLMTITDSTTQMDLKIFDESSTCDIASYIMKTQYNHTYTNSNSTLNRTLTSVL
jgi:hypothetical protein